MRILVLGGAFSMPGYQDERFTRFFTRPRLQQFDFRDFMLHSHRAQLAIYVEHHGEVQMSHSLVFKRSS